MSKKIFFISIFVLTFLTLNLFADTPTATDVAKKGWKAYIDIAALMNLLISFLVAMLSLATKALITFINHKTEEAKAKTENVLAKNAFGMVNHLIIELIEAESGKLKELIEKVLKDGKVTEEEKQMVVEELRNEALRILGESGLNRLEAFIGDSKEWISKKVAAFLSEKLSAVTSERQAK